MDTYLHLAACEGPIVLQVLNVGHAKLIGKVKVGALTSLGALILNDNALTSISGKTHARLKNGITGCPCLAHTACLSTLTHQDLCWSISYPSEVVLV